MKQVVMSYCYRHNMSEISKNISDTLASEPTWSVQTISTITYHSMAGLCFDAIVVYNVDRPQDTLDTPKLAGDVWDNGYRLPVYNDPIPCINKEGE